MPRMMGTKSRCEDCGEGPAIFVGVKVKNLASPTGYIIVQKRLCESCASNNYLAYKHPDDRYWSDSPDF